MREVLVYPDQRLRVPATPVSLPPDDAVVALSRDLRETLAVADGMGLAAGQLGFAQAIIALDLDLSSPETSGSPSETSGSEPPERGRYVVVLLNPEIVYTEGRVIGEEGCLSFPELYVDLPRPEFVTLSGHELVGRDARPITLDVEGLVARAACHEVDHLDGKLMIDLLEPVARAKALFDWRRILAARSSGS